MPFDSSEEILEEMEREEVFAMDASPGEMEKERSTEEKRGTTKKKGKKKTPRRRRKSKKGRGMVMRILSVSFFLLVVGVLGYLGYLFTDVDNVLQPDVPQDQLTYRYPGEESSVEGVWIYSPRTVAFRREKAYETVGTSYQMKIFPIYQEEKAYVNDIMLLSEEPPFFGEFLIGSFKTINDMTEGDVLAFAGSHMEDSLYFMNIEQPQLLEQKVLEHRIDGKKAFYNEFLAHLPRGADEPSYVRGRDVKVVMVYWVSEEDMSGKYFIGFSVVRINNEGNVLIPSVIEDETTWDKIISLIPRVSVEN